MEHKDATQFEATLNYPGNEEQIILKPSTELIPDEYEHDNNSAALVHIFRGRYAEDDNNTGMFTATLQELGFEVPRDNVHYVMRKEEVEKDLDAIAAQATDKSSLIILFLGLYREDDKFLCDENEVVSTREVWIHFIGSKCPELRNKPKIFLFIAAEFIAHVQRDMTRPTCNDKEGFYELPAEADMLIVYKKVEMRSSFLRNIFMRDLCNNIKDFGKRDDIISLITDTEDEHGHRPLIISTLTRKFYFTSSKVRGHHLELHESHSGLQATITDLHTKITKLQQQYLKALKKQGAKKDAWGAVRKQLSSKVHSPSKVNGITAPVVSPTVSVKSDTKQRASSVTDQPNLKGAKLGKRGQSLSDRPPWR